MHRPTPSLILPALLAGLAGCGASSMLVGGPCDSSGACGDGLICDHTAPSGPACIDVGGDLDGDGIPNGKDFCEHMVGGDHDEDQDGLGDECDPCPIARPPGQADTDHDAVDSPCDPDPRTAGDRIILFNGFNAPISGAPASWAFQGGEVVVTPGTAGSVEELVLPVPRSTIHMAILAGYRIDAVAAGAVDAGVSVVSKTVLPMGNSETQCGAARIGGSDAILVQTTAVGGAMNQNTKPLPDVFDPAAQYRIVEQIDGPTTNCALAGDATNSGAIQLASDGTAPTQVVLRVRGATVRFAYLLVVAR